MTTSATRLTRTQEQNERFWSRLHDISRQVDWPVDGRVQKVDEESWKHIFSAALKKHQRVAAGIDGGFVILGQSTRRFTIQEMSDMLNIISAFGDERFVKWSDPKQAALDAAHEAEAGRT